MSFLVPAVLWGLVAATIPLIIHLFSNRRIQTVEFSSIRFIKELEYETIRKLKIRQLILLILRTIAVILIVVAFARPVKLGYFPLGSSKTTQMVFLIDNSASLSALNDQDEILLSQSKAKARRILEEIEGDIHFQLWQTTPLLRIFSGEYNSVDEVAGYLEAINESAGSDDLWGAIDSILDRSAWEAQGGKISANNEFYIFSDFPGTVSDNWQFHKVRRQSDPNWHVFLLPVDDPGQNLRIRDIEVLTELRVAEQLVEIQTSIENQGDDDLRDIPVQLFFGDIPVGQAVSDVPAGKLKEFNFQAYPTHSESVEGNVIIPDDYYHFDNRRYFKFSVPDRINCVIAGSSEDQMELVEFALEAMNSDSVFVQFKRQNLTANSMLPLTPIDILLLVDPDLLSSFIVEQIADFQTLGGGVLVFLGDHSLNSNDNFLDQLGISGIVGFLLVRLTFGHPD
ncbi:MAG: BatA domain-containing protein [Fidelibacterota bacterium]